MEALLESERAERRAQQFKKVERALTLARAAPVTLGFFKKDGALRRMLMSAIVWPGTGVFLTLCIIVNTAAFCFFNPLNRNSEGNTRIFWITMGTSVVFTIETVAKVIAFGIRGPGGFLSDPWNFLDVLIVLLGYAEFSKTLGHVSGMRILRLVRPLQYFSGVRVVLNTFLKALPGLASVLALACLSYVLVALVGVELWTGVMGGTCGYTDPNTGDFLLTSAQPTYGSCALPCSSFSGMCTWTFGDECGSAYGTRTSASNGTNSSTWGNFSIPMTCAMSTGPSQGQAQFDNFGRGLMMAFVMATTEGWSSYMYTLWHTWGLKPIVTVILATHVLFGAWFVLELTLAVVSEQYDKAVEAEAIYRSDLLRAVQALKMRGDHELAHDVVEDARDAIDLASIASAALQVKRALSGQIDVSKGDGESAVIPGDESTQSSSCMKETRRRLVTCDLTLGCIGRAFYRACLAVPRVVPRNMQLVLQTVVKSTAFSSASLFLILANTILLSLDRYGASPSLVSALRNGNYALCTLFMLEVLLRWAAAGFDFWNRGFNVAEAVIAALSLCDALVQITGFDSTNPLLFVFQSTRALRILRLAWFYKGWLKVLELIALAVPRALSALALLLVFLLTAAVVGMQIFGGGGYAAAVVNGLIETVPNLNFNTIHWALITAYEVSDNENWNDTVYTHMAAFGPSSALFFIAIVAVGNYFVLNIFVSILLRGFETKRRTVTDEQWTGSDRPDFIDLLRRAGLDRFEEARAEEIRAGSSYACLRACGFFPRRATSYDHSHGRKSTVSALLKHSAASPSLSVTMRGENASASSDLPSLRPQLTARVPPLRLAGIGLSDSSVPATPHSIVTHKTDAGADLLRIRAIISSRVGRSAELQPLQISITRIGGIDVKQLRDVGPAGASKVKKAKRELLVAPNAEGVELTSRLTTERETLSARIASPAGIESAFALPCLRLSECWLALRVLCTRVTSTPLFDLSIIAVIVWSCVNLTLDSPALARCASGPQDDVHAQSCRQRKLAVNVSDAIILVIFWGEVAMQMIARGVLGGSRKSYFGSSWRILDFSVVVISTISFIPGNAGLGILKALRAVRALRPLRLIARFPGLRLVINAMLYAIPRAQRIFVVVFLFLYTFAVMGVQFFNGAMPRCTDSTISTQEDCTGTFVLHGDLCAYLPTLAQEKACKQSSAGVLFPRLWTTYPTSINYAGESFADTPHSLLVVFELLMGENWPGIMQNAIDGGHGDGVVERNANQLAAIYFILSQIVLNTFLVKMFTGAVIDTFKRKQDAARGSSLLTPQQRIWVKNIRRTLQSWCFRLLSWLWFERCITAAIIANLLFMALKHANQDLLFYRIETYSNAVFTVFFGAEAIVKVVGLGPRQYFSAIWNVFDFVLAVAGAASAIFAVGSVGIMLRLVRALRIVRLVKFSASLQRTVRAFILALPSFINVMLVLGIFLFIFSIIGMHAFSGIRQSDLYYLNQDAHFEDFPTSLITLIRGVTGENWNGIMYAMTIQAPFCVPTGPNINCGWSIGVSSAYWIAFQTICNIILVPLLTAAVLEAYAESSNDIGTEQNVFVLSQELAEKYRELWSEADPRRTMFLPEQEIVRLISRLPRPLGTACAAGVNATLNPMLTPAKMSRRSLVQDADPVVAATALLRTLPIILDSFGRIHFHILLQALVDSASDKPPLGAPTRAITVARRGMSPSAAQITVHHTAAVRKMQERWRRRAASRADARRAAPQSPAVSPALIGRKPASTRAALHGPGLPLDTDPKEDALPVTVNPLHRV